MTDGNILITGATGQIGQLLIRLLPESPIIGLSRNPGLSEGQMHHPSITWLKHDLTSGIPTLTQFGPIRAVVHLAASLDLFNFARAFRTNVLGCISLLRGLRHLRIGHFIAASSIDAVGPVSEPPIKPITPRKPVTPYGNSKAMMEVLLTCWSRANGIPLTLVRLGHVWTEDRGLPIAIHRKAESPSSRFLLHALFGRHTLHLLHAEDAARWISATIAGEADGTLVQAASEVVSVKDLLSESKGKRQNSTQDVRIVRPLERIFEIAFYGRQDPFGYLLPTTERIHRTMEVSSLRSRIHTPRLWEGGPSS